MLVNNTEKKTHRIGNHQTRMPLRIRRKKYIHKYIETAVIGMNWYLCEINRKFPSHSVSTTSALGSRFIAANECRSVCVCRRVSVGLCMVPTQSAFHDNMHTKRHTTHNMLSTCKNTLSRSQMSGVCRPIMHGRRDSFRHYYYGCVSDHFA